MTKIYTDGNSRAVIDHYVDGGQRIAFYIQGGGFLYTVPRDEFHRRFKLELEPPKFRLALVSGDWLTHEDETKRLPCYTDGTRWNGWAVPWFERWQVLYMMALDPNGMFEGTTYDKEKDQFVFDPAWREEQGQDVEFWPGQDIETPDGTKHLYQIGDGWCWDFIEWIDE